MLNIQIKTIPHNEQRYDTVGDWYLEDGVLKFRISKLDDNRMEAMVAIHELVEAVLCEAVGVTQIDVDKFDFNYKEDGEAGDNRKSPYRFQHNFATAIERILCGAFGINWQDYEERLNNL